ncbi:aldolase/citrate lyase family protein [Burkholderia sp. Ax-1724]|uniref:HpcH/HpaI aldolase family protein n=1 Tax=Burkholderia sp. Ax-1724 TaxID=2608336 RepID=UPI00141E5536|nr:aldolase/citrate lyase family protein [Burkholderia sp. Ax-1724]NIF56079.1 aldolase [Burkholderia sp. Ax-1724]
MKVAARDLVRNVVKEKLARDEVALSMTVRLVRTAEIVTIAKTAGFDTFYIDLEHSTLSIESAAQICMTAMNAGIAPFVRLPNLSPDVIARILDGGALGVIAPHVESAEQARQVVRAAKFPPLGERSHGGVLPHMGFRSLPSSEVGEAVNDATMVVIMIETKEALAAIDEIAAIDGVDLLFIGTNDLCASLGIPGQFEHEMIRDAYSKGMTACRKHGKHLGVGGLNSHPKLVAQFVEMGARYVSAGTDISFLLSAASAKAAVMRDL